MIVEKGTHKKSPPHEGGNKRRLKGASRGSKHVGRKRQKQSSETGVDLEELSGGDDDEDDYGLCGG